MTDDPPRARNRFRRHRRKLLVVMLTCAIVGLDAAAFQVLKHVGRGTRRREAEKTFRVKSERYHHDLRPNVQVQDVRWGTLSYETCTNSLGFRDAAPREVPLAAPHRRVLMIGDSFTEGIAINYSATWVARVEQALRRTDPTVEVLNAGVSSYFPAIYEEKLRYWIGEQGLAVSEVVLFLDISDIEDQWLSGGFGPGAEDRDSLAPKEKEGPLGFVRHRTILLGGLLGLFDTPPPPGPRREWKALWTIDEGAFEAYGREGIERSRTHLTALAELLRARGIPLTLAVYPWPTQLDNGDRDSRQVKVWREWAAAQGVRFVDLFPTFFDAAPTPAAVLERYYIDGDCHWSEAGHQLVADALAPLLVTPPPTGGGPPTPPLGGGPR